MKTNKEIIALIDAEIQKCKAKALKLAPCKTSEQFNEWYRLLGAVNALEAIKDESKDPVDHFKEGYSQAEERDKANDRLKALDDAFKRKAYLDLIANGWALTELRVKEQPKRLPKRIVITKPNHPLRGKEYDVTSVYRNTVTVRTDNGTEGFNFDENEFAVTEYHQPELPESSKLETIKVLSEALNAVNGVPGYGVAGTQTHEVKKAQEAIAKRLHELINTL